MRVGKISSNGFLIEQAANKEMKINRKVMKFPFVWFSLSNRESALFQSKVFEIAKPEGLLASITELGQGNAKAKREDLIYTMNDKKLLIKIDSGGFSYYRNNINPHPIEVLQNQLKYSPDFLVQLDLPLGANASDKERIANITYTKNNLNEIYHLIDSKKHILVPTIHGWTNKELNLSIKNLRNSGFDPKIISIGSLVPLLTSRYGGGVKKWGGRNQAFKIIKKVRNEFPGIPLHILGAGGALTPILLGLGVDSIDSTGWIKKAAFGCINFCGTSDRFFYTNGFKKLKYRTGILDDPNSKEKWENCNCKMCEYSRNSERWDDDIRFFMYGRKNLDSFNNKEGRRLRATHNMSIQLNDIIEGRIAIKNNTFEEYIQERMKNSNYRKLAEQLFKIKIPRGEKSIYENGNRSIVVSKDQGLLDLKKIKYFGPKLASNYCNKGVTSNIINRLDKIHSLKLYENLPKNLRKTYMRAKNNNFKLNK